MDRRECERRKKGEEEERETVVENELKRGQMYVIKKRERER